MCCKAGHYWWSVFLYQVQCTKKMKRISKTIIIKTTRQLNINPIPHRFHFSGFLLCPDNLITNNPKTSPTKSTLRIPSLGQYPYLCAIK
jgi:hypothetical protein